MNKSKIWICSKNFYTQWYRTNKCFESFKSTYEVDLVSAQAWTFNRYTHVFILFRFTYIVVVSHVHPTVQHDVFASDGHEDAAAADILSSTLDRECRNWESTNTILLKKSEWKCWKQLFYYRYTCTKNPEALLEESETPRAGWKLLNWS